MSDARSSLGLEGGLDGEGRIGGEDVVGARDALGAQRPDGEDIRVAIRPHNEPVHRSGSRSVGLKNWLFCRRDDGAHWNATATSLIASCQLHGIEAWAYLRDVLTLLPTWPLSRALELSPKLLRGSPYGYCEIYVD